MLWERFEFPFDLSECTAAPDGTRRRTLERVPGVSDGLAARTVLLGSLPLEFFYAHPFQRPGEDSVFGLRIGIGW